MSIRPLSQQPQATFLGAPFVEARERDLKKHGARAALLGIPYDMGGIFRTGTAAGPRGLREASRQYGGYFFDDDVDLLEAFRLVDCGDVRMVPANPEQCRAAAKAAAKEIIRSGAMGIYIGGDHSIPIPLGEAISEETQGKVGYIVFDANMDAEEEVDGELNSNWSEVCRLAELGNIDPRNMVLIGIRGALNTRRQTDYLRDRGIRTIGMREVIGRGIEDVMSEALSMASDGTNALYVSFDTDGIDAAYAPGTSGPESGGLPSREILSAARMIGTHGATMFDIVEYCPAYDPSGITGKLCCYIIFHLHLPFARRALCQRGRCVTADRGLPDEGNLDPSTGLWLRQSSGIEQFVPASGSQGNQGTRLTRNRRGASRRSRDAEGLQP